MTFEEWLETDTGKTLQALQHSWSGMVEELHTVFGQWMMETTQKLVPAMRGLAEAFERMKAETRSFAYGTLRRYGVPHWMARLAARAMPFDLAWRLAEKASASRSRQ